MKKILLINAVCGIGSTGRIVADLWKTLKDNGYEAKVAFGVGRGFFVDEQDQFKFNNKLGYYWHNALSRITDRAGFYSSIPTLILLHFIDRFKPDLIHLHNLHGYYINIRLLFNYIKRHNIPVVWTLHDCWAFTGHCTHFIMHGCEKWKTGCGECQFLDEYPQSWFVDRSKRNYQLKRHLFISMGDRLTLVPVSKWLEGLIRQSFLKDMRIYTIHNGIDLSLFKATQNEEIRKKYNLIGKKVVIGVALPWSSYKGYRDFLKLREYLDDEYAIIMVGLSEDQMNEIPSGIIGITQTDSPRELAELYTLASVLVNTTYCDNYPTVNLEAIACGTPVITYRTGGSPESIDKSTGAVVDQGDFEALLLKIREICENSAKYSAACIAKAELLFDKSKCFAKYLNIYQQAIN